MSDAGIYSTSQKLRGWQFQTFVTNVLNDLRKRKNTFNLGRLDISVRNDMRRRGVEVKSSSVIISGDVIRKYITHPKSKKGATLHYNKFWILSQIVRKPSSIYVDKRSKYLIYIFTGKKSLNGNVIKAVIQPNYVLKINKRKVNRNLLKSIGVVNNKNMNQRLDYERIK